MKMISKKSRNSPNPQLFGREYFSSWEGKGYRREILMSHFKRLANYIVKEISPGTVLEVGCAKGFLLECLRDLGVDAEGIDISSYAIGQVREDIRPYCRVCSVLDLSVEAKRYDLVIAIGVLEHLSAQDAFDAVANISKLTDVILFSSTPDRNYPDPTHVNVQPIEYWIDLFARFGFKPDSSLDPAVVAPHAVLFRRKDRKKIFYITAGYLWPHTEIDGFLIRAFKRLGHRVVVYDLQPQTFMAQAYVNFGLYDKEQIRHFYSSSLPPQGILEEVKKTNPDLLFCLQGYMIPRDILLKIKKIDIPSSVWFMDEPYDLARTIDFGRFFSYVFLQDSSTVECHRRHGNPNTFFLPHGFDDLGVHRKRRDLDEEHVSDVCLVGSYFPRRKRIIRTLAGLPAKISIVGPGWGRFKCGSLISLNKVVSLWEAARYHSGAKINLNIHRSESDVTTHRENVVAKSPNGTFFYIAGCGGFQIVDESREDISRFFKVGREVITFSDKKDLQEKVKFYIENPEERREIADAAYRRAVSEHTYSHRLQQMLNVIESQPITHKVTVPFYNVGIVLTANKGKIVDKALGKYKMSIQFLLIDQRRHVIFKIPSLGGETIPFCFRQKKPYPFLATAINRSILESSSSYVAIAFPGVTLDLQAGEKYLKAFTTTSNLGALQVYSKSEGQSIPTMLILPREVVMNIGMFDSRFSTAGFLLEDYVLRVKLAGYNTKEVVEDADSYGETITTNPIVSDSMDMMKDEIQFSRKWSLDPDARITAMQLVLKGRGLYNRGDFQAAKELFAEAVDVSPSYYMAYKMLGLSLLNLGDFAEAERVLKFYCWNVLDIESILLYSLALYSCKDYTQAINLLQKVTKAVCASPEEKAIAYYQMGESKAKLNKLKEAESCLIRSLELAPDSYDTLVKLGKVSAQLEDFKQAQDLLCKAIELNPQKEEAFNNLGVVLWKVGQKKEALEKFQKALSINPGYLEALRNLSGCGFELKKFSLVKQYLANYLELYPSNCEIKSLLRRAEAQQAIS
ncbi:MAG TPA: tetratricopeptide repeat protein [Candidatus Latescibacteria bacterium]|nr:tetratricopeptide repeat protein [Candidatus Latescibacterota bacterium]